MIKLRFALGLIPYIRDFCRCDQFSEEWSKSKWIGTLHNAKL